jgi:glyoxylase I family protein
VFGWKVLRRLAAGEAGTPRILPFDPATGFAMGMCRPEDGFGERFDHRRTCLDLFAFGVADEVELDRWIAHLDGIQLELWTNASG